MRSSSGSRKTNGNPPLRSKASAFSLSRKAQFLIITAFVIVSIFYLVSRWMEPYRIPDTSSAVLEEEPFIFNNVKEQSLRIVNESASCEELTNNLDEYKNYVEDFAFKKLVIYFDYTISTPCYAVAPGFPILVLFDIRLGSQSVTTNAKYYGFWPPGSAP